VASFCEHVNELTESREGGDFFKQSKLYYFLKNDPASWSYCIYKTVHEAPAVNKWGCHAKINFATRNTQANSFRVTPYFTCSSVTVNQLCYRHDKEMKQPRYHFISIGLS